MLINILQLENIIFVRDDPVIHPLYKSIDVKQGKKWRVKKNRVILRNTSYYTLKEKLFSDFKAILPNIEGRKKKRGKTRRHIFLLEKI